MAHANGEKGRIGNFILLKCNTWYPNEAIRSRLSEAGDRVAAVREAAGERLRPVLTTAITDAVGFLPMALRSLY